MLEFWFDTVIEVLSRPPYGIQVAVAKWATDYPCLSRDSSDGNGGLDVFAVQTHLDGEGRPRIYGETLLAICNHYGLDELAVFKAVKDSGGQVL